MSVYRTRNSDLGNNIRNSISEILPKKSQDSIERTKFQQSQHASLVKAINSLETPVKEKHVRNIILGTCYEKSALPFWFNVLKLDLYGNQIICWKFCYTVHKLLRDGYSTCVNDSFRYVGTFEDLAKSWIHLKQGYGMMIYHYCKYLAVKVKFHKKNQFIPANLLINDKDLEDLAANDINNYFQLCCEFFDYSDEIISLQNAIFVTMDRSRSNSMIESGQLKLAPLILCIQESNQLYDFTVKFMFKLHENLPGDTLDGHRERFNTLFRHLKKFYECCKNLQYFKNLISIPDLPNIPPNFRIKSEFESYSKPVMVVVDTAAADASSLNDDTESILVDFSDNNNNNQPLNSSSSSSNDISFNSMKQIQQLQQQNQQQQEQQFQYIQQLLREIEHLRNELDRLSVESEFEIRSLRDRIKDLESELILNKSELEQQKIKSTNLEEKVRIMNENEKAKAEVEHLEKKAVSSEEKFNKMKELYNKLKGEHVQLLRQEADVRKQKASLAESCELASKVKSELEKRLDEAGSEKTKAEKALQEKLIELETLKTESEKVQAEKMTFDQKHLFETQQLGNEKKHLETNLEEANKQLDTLKSSEKSLQEKYANSELEVKKLSDQFDSLKEQIKTLTQNLNDLSGQKDLAAKMHHLNQTKLRENVLSKALETGREVIAESLHLFDDPILFNCKSGADYLLAQLQPFEANFKELIAAYNRYQQSHKEDTSSSPANDEEDENFVKLLKNLSLFANLISESVVSGKVTSIAAAGIDLGEQLAELCKMSGQCALEVLEKMSSRQPLDHENAEVTQRLDSTMLKIAKILHDLLPKVHDISKEEIGDLIEQEMHNTSQAIEAAVAKLEALLTKSKEQDTGVKLEVNDKIIDNCSALMKAIKVLIIRAIDLQKEIVAQGRGASSVKEFYAKNHKWSEGLVTAAKLVGLGANVLIEKTDKFVNGNGKLEEIIVSSNEIAASTAQLVVASNVKADRESQNRIALIDAKNHVSTATAGLVATAKSCLQTFDDQNAMDFTKMSLHQTKLLEMEAQVKVLELEKQLENEKNKLYKLRKQHYKMEN